MLIACWSVKGGSGTTVVAASLALVLERRGIDVTLVDLAGDAAAVLGMPEPSGPGLSEWAEAGVDVPAAALAALASPVSDHLKLVHRGSAALERADGEHLAVALAAVGTVVVDCGLITQECRSHEVRTAVARAATQSLLVMRPCFLSLRSALAAPLRPSSVVLVLDQQRALGRADVEDVLGVPVCSEVRWDPAVARAVDAGLLRTAMPAPLSKAMQTAA